MTGTAFRSKGHSCRAGGCGGPDKQQTSRWSSLFSWEESTAWWIHAKKHSWCSVKKEKETCLVWGKHRVVHHWRNTGVQIWRAWIVRFLRSYAERLIHVVLRNSTPVRNNVGRLTEALVGTTTPRCSFSKIHLHSMQSTCVFNVITTTRHDCLVDNNYPVRSPEPRRWRAESVAKRHALRR